MLWAFILQSFFCQLMVLMKELSLISLEIVQLNSVSSALYLYCTTFTKTFTMQRSEAQSFYENIVY